MLELDGVCKSWNRFKLADVSLQVPMGEYLVILGPTGAGKTLLLETIMGFHIPDHGKVLLDGRNITETLPEKRGIGYVPQSCVLFPHMTVRKNMEFGLRVRGIKDVERKARVDRIVDSMSLNHLENLFPTTLSGGERQKVALARVLAIEPRLILLDEPLSSLDADTKRGMKDELRRIHRELQVAVVHVTHDQMEAFSLAEKVAVMRNGRIVQTGNVADVFGNPRDEFVARFLGYENIFEAKVKQTGGGFSLLESGSLVVRAAVNVKSEACMIGVRPEDIILGRTQLSGMANTFKGTVQDMIDLGSVVSVAVKAGLPFEASVAKRAFLDMRLDQAQEVWIGFDAESVKVFE